MERIANELGGGREHWGHWVPADSSNEGVGIGPVTRVGESNHSYCYKIIETRSPTADVSAYCPDHCYA